MHRLNEKRGMTYTGIQKGAPWLIVNPDQGGQDNGKLLQCMALLPVFGTSFQFSSTFWLEVSG